MTTSNQQQKCSHQTLDALPKSLIGEIASNLDQRDYATLSRTNKAICIGCNDPNRLVSMEELGLSSFKNDGQGFEIILSKYPQIQNLDISLQNIPIFPADGTLICHRLQCLNLWLGVYEDDINAFLQQQCLSTAHLQCLSLKAFFRIYSAETLKRLFATFYMIQHLDLFVSDVSSDFDLLRFEETLSDSFPNLNALTLHDTNRLGSAILKYRGGDLTQLELDDFELAPPLSIDELNEIDFSKLQRFSIKKVSDDVVYAISRTARNLVAVHWVFNTREDSEESVENTERIQWIIKDIAYCSRWTLTDLHIDIYDANTVENVCTAIEMILLSTRHQKRSTLRIGVECGDERMTLMQSNLFFSRILNKLAGSNVDQYVLFWKMSHQYCNCSEDTPEKLKHLCHWKWSTWVGAVKDAMDMVESTPNAETLSTVGSMYIIKNSNGTANSYEKWWNRWRGKHYRVIY